MGLDVTACPFEVEIRQGRVVGTWPGDQHVVDGHWQFSEELLEPLKVGGVERCGAQRADLACGLLKAFRVAADKNDTRAFGSCSSGCLEPDSQAAADYDDLLPGECRCARDGGGG